MSTYQPDINRIQRAVHDHWVLLLVEGVVLVVLGATAVVIAPLATLAVTILFGWLFFSELPAPAVYLGAAIVIASGAFIAWRERQLGIERAAERAAKPI